MAILYSHKHVIPATRMYGFIHMLIGVTVHTYVTEHSKRKWELQSPDDTKIDKRPPTYTPINQV